MYFCYSKTERFLPIYAAIDPTFVKSFKTARL